MFCSISAVLQGWGHLPAHIVSCTPTHRLEHSEAKAAPFFLLLAGTLLPLLI